MMEYKINAYIFTLHTKLVLVLRLKISMKISILNIQDISF